MSLNRICDHCKQTIDTEQGYIHIEYHSKISNKKSLLKIVDYHLDCFNYKFSCDIRQIESEVLK